jgi:hypothetical protein
MEQETTTSAAPTFFNHVLKWAVIMAVVGILLAIIMYVIDYTLMVQFKMLLIALAIYLGIAIFAGIEYRNSIGGFMSYGKAWQHAMAIFAISALITTMFNLLLYNVIDPELPGKLAEATLENQRAMMANFGAPEDQIDKEIEKARERTENQFKPAGQALGYLIILAFSAVMALISSIFVKKNEPVDM